MPLSKTEGPLVPTKLSDTHGGDMGFGMDFEIGEQTEAHELSTPGEGTPTIST